MCSKTSPSSLPIYPALAAFLLWPQNQGWQHIKLVGSNLELRQVSWKKRVEVIPSRLSTDTEMSSDEVPHPSSSQTPLPGDDHSTRSTDRQADSPHGIEIMFLALSFRLWSSSFCTWLAPFPPVLPPAAQHWTLASTAPHPVDGRGWGLSRRLPLSVLSPSH